jgi:hypothetical protein
MVFSCFVAKGNRAKSIGKSSLRPRIADEIKAAAAEAGIKELGLFSRGLLTWAFGHHKNAPSLRDLKKAR